MVARTVLSIPTKGALLDTHRLPASNGDVYKALSRLPRAALLRLVLQWLDDVNVARCMPFLTHDETEDEASDDAPYLPAQSVEELRETYQELQARKGGKRDIVDRILEGDWRHGISLFQLAMADALYLQERLSSQKWHALRLAMVRDDDEEEEEEADAARDEQQTLPRFQQQAFVQSLQREVGPLAKAHYHLTREDEKAYTLLRIFSLDLPYNTQRALSAASTSRRGATEGAKSIFAVFPDASPFVYVSMPTSATTPAGSESRSLQRIIIDAIPKALSRPQARYEFKTTALSAKTLPALLALRGSGRSNAAAGGWSIFVDDTQGQSALACAESGRKRSRAAVEEHHEGAAPPTESAGEVTCMDPSGTREHKRRKAIAEGRFGDSGMEGDDKGIERFEVRIDDAYPKMPSGSARVLEQLDQWRASDKENQHEQSQTKPLKSGRKARPSLLDTAVVDGVQSTEDANSWRPDIRLSFQGSHVFAGIRQLVEKGIVDGERMPSWMTGEAGVSIGAVRHGRMLAKADSVL